MKSSLKLSFIVFLCGFFISTLLAIYFSSPLSWLVWLSTTLGMLAAKDAKDGKWTNFLFDIISYLTYIIVCIKENYYGELILSFIVIVINIFSIINSMCVDRRTNKNSIQWTWKSRYNKEL